MYFFGCAYYPEAWPAERLSEDIRLMREAHINGVRMGEFNWGKFEPSEGQFDFAFWHEIIAKLYENGISTVLCTPTAAPPKWMSFRYPAILKQNADGRPFGDCNRRHACPSSPEYREFARRIVRRMAEEFAEEPGVAAWQLDNEIAAEAEGGFCYCPECVKRFRMWLREKYNDSIASLNQAWNGAFWSAAYSSFDEIQPQTLKRTSHIAEYARFMSRVYTGFACEQRDILRAGNPKWEITTNSWGSFIPDVAVDEIFSELDTPACDSYVNSDQIEFYRSMWDLYRNLKGECRPFLIAETAPWNPVSTFAGNQEAIRVWAFDAVAHGARSLFYFRWRQSLMGEENDPAILPHNGLPGMYYEVVKQIGSEWEKFSRLPLPASPVLILTDPDITGYVTKYRHGGDYSYFRAIVRANMALNRLGVSADIRSVRQMTPESWTQYKLLILPQIEYVSPALIRHLKEFEQNGGVILAQCRLNRLDEFGKFRLDPAPFGMEDLFGMKVAEWCAIADRTNFRKFSYKDSPDAARIPRLETKQFSKDVVYDTFMERILPADCDILERYSAGAYTGTPLLTRKGNAFYQAVPLGETGTREVMRHAAEAAHLPLFDLPSKTLRLELGGKIIRINAAPKAQIVDGVSIKGYGFDGIE